MRIFFLNFFLIVGGTLLSANLTLDTAEVEVRHYPLLMQPSSAAFAKTFTAVSKKSEDVSEEINLYDALKEQMLEGYRLFDNIQATCICDERFFQKGVREFIAQRQPFFSENLEYWLQVLGKLLQQGLSLPSPKTGIFGRMNAHYMQTRIYGRGQKRKWSLVEVENLQDRGIQERVCILLKGEPFALEGVVCAEDPGDDTHDARNLLALKRRYQSSPQKHLLREEPWERAAVARFFARKKKGKKNISIMFWQDRRRFCLNIDGQARFSWKDAEYSDRTSVDMSLSALCEQAFLRGFVPKNRVQEDSADVPSIMHPRVRNVVCGHQAFTDERLHRVFGSLRDRLKPGLAEEWAIFYKDNPDFVWSIVDDEEFLDSILHKEHIPVTFCGHVFLFMRGESVALHGVPVPTTHDGIGSPYSLWSYWAKSLQKDVLTLV